MKIKQILDKIDENRIFVPEFHREFVCKIIDAKNLIDSLIKDYPTGQMLTWETDNPPELKGDHHYQASNGAVKIILDGQQRITTLYMLIKGEIPPYYRANQIENDIRKLYVNVETLELDYYNVKTMESNPLWVDLTDIFKGQIRPRDIINELENINNGESLAKARSYAIVDNIFSIKCIEEKEFSELKLVNYSIKEAIDIFNRVNVSGINLTNGKIALA